MTHAMESYAEKEEIVGAEMMRNFEKGVMLQTLDSLWKEHLAAMDYLRIQRLKHHAFFEVAHHLCANDLFFLSVAFHGMGHDALTQHFFMQVRLA